jgi:hypothetical protein
MGQTDFFQQGRSIHARHPHVAYDNIHACGFAKFQCHFAAGGKMGTPFGPFRVQTASKPIEYVFVIIDEQNFIH